MAVAVLVAAGRGERLGAERPKAFVMLGGKPMIEWSLDALRPAVAEVVVALPPGVEAPAGCIGVEGGEHRSLSVRNALRAAPPGDPIVVHDAARPLITPAQVRATIEALGDHDGAIAAAPVTDTVKEVDGSGNVVHTLDRSKLWAVQTPQVFRRAALERALFDHDDAVLARATDDAWLVERIGGRVKVVPFPPDNLKVTTPLDLEIAERALC
jgi:2-C-methyl-D-erythritol 4-phosphate cytidylyltransferase